MGAAKRLNVQAAYLKNHTFFQISRQWFVGHNKDTSPRQNQPLQKYRDDYPK